MASHTGDTQWQPPCGVAALTSLLVVKKKERKKERKKEVEEAKAKVFFFFSFFLFFFATGGAAGSPRRFSTKNRSVFPKRYTIESLWCQTLGSLPSSEQHHYSDIIKYIFNTSQTNFLLFSFFSFSAFQLFQLFSFLFIFFFFSFCVKEKLLLSRRRI